MSELQVINILLTGIAASDVQSSRRNVDSEDSCILEATCKTDGDATRSGADVANGEGLRNRRGNIGRRRWARTQIGNNPIDEFGSFGPRNEHIGAHLETHAIEPRISQGLLDGNTLFHSSDDGREPRTLFGSEDALGMQETIGARDAAHFLEQKVGDGTHFTLVVKRQTLRIGHLRQLRAYYFYCVKHGAKLGNFCERLT